MEKYSDGNESEGERKRERERERERERQRGRQRQTETKADCGKELQNKYHGETSDATTASSLIVSLTTTSCDVFYPQKRPYSSFEIKTGQMHRRTDLRT